MPGPIWWKFAGSPVPSGVGGCDLSSSIVMDMVRTGLVMVQAETRSCLRIERPGMKHWEVIMISRFEMLEEFASGRLCRFKISFEKTQRIGGQDGDF